MSEIVATIERALPALVRDNKGKDRFEGTFNIFAAAKYAADNPEKLYTAADFCRLFNERASPCNVDLRRRYLSKIADVMIENGVAAVLEWSGRKIIAVGRYNPQNEYHQRLMAEEIARRKVRHDGSWKRLEHIIQFLPVASAA